MTNETKSMELHTKHDKKHDFDKYKMQQALTAITQEIQRFHFNNDAYSSDDMFEVIKQYKLNFKLKQQQIKTMSEHIKMACTVGRVLLSVKEKQSKTLKMLLNTLSYDSANFFQEILRYKDSIEIFTKENKILEKKVNKLENFINLAYDELKKYHNEPIEIENPSTYIKLKYIIMCCSQYNTNYKNESLKCKQLEQKNTFLRNKLKILEINLKIMNREIERLHYLNMKLKHQKHFFKDKDDKIKNLITTSESEIGKHYVKTSSHWDTTTIFNTNKLSKLSKVKDFNLTSHLSLVKDLLRNQEEMVYSLKQLSNELNSPNL